MLMLQPGLLHAADNAGAEMSIALNAGESYIINNVSPGEVPAVKVIANPHALVVHNEEPGKVVLLGAEAGEWNISVKTADGPVNYDVRVKSVGSAFATGPGPIAVSGKSSGSAAAPVVAKLDSGAGPVNPSSSSAGTATTAVGPETVAAASPGASAPLTAAPRPRRPRRLPADSSTFDFAPSVPAALVRYATSGALRSDRFGGTVE